MQRVILLLGVLMSVFACKLDEPQLPIEESKLVPILKDVQLAEAIIKQQNFVEQDSLVKTYYGIIYRTHQIKKEDLDSTFAILRSNPAMMDRIYTQVLEELTKEEIKQ